MESKIIFEKNFSPICRALAPVRSHVAAPTDGVIPTLTLETSPKGGGKMVDVLMSRPYDSRFPHKSA